MNQKKLVIENQQNAWLRSMKEYTDAENKYYQDPSKYDKDVLESKKKELVDGRFDKMPPTGFLKIAAKPINYNLEDTMNKMGDPQEQTLPNETKMVNGMMSTVEVKAKHSEEQVRRGLV